MDAQVQRDIPVSILMVDDHAENLVALKAILSSPDYRLVEATSGGEALRRLLEDEFAILLLDVVMPDIDGFELASIIKQRERTATIPILFLTGLATDVEHVYKGYRAGAVDYLVKPLMPEMVRSKVAVFAELYRQRKRIEQQAALLVEAERQVESRLEQEARTDALTGCANRRRFQELAKHELARVQRHGGAISLLMLDLDRFKMANDRYGHLAGDLLLIKVAEICRQILREQDVVARLGGDEFAILLPQTDLDKAMEVGERMREAIAAAEVSVEGYSAMQFTVSVGATSLRPGDDGIDALLRRADQALYDAKTAGRNTVRSA